MTLANFRSDDQRRRRRALDVLVAVVRANDAVFETRRRGEGGRGRSKHFFVPFFSEKSEECLVQFFSFLLTKMSYVVFYKRLYAFDLSLKNETDVTASFVVSRRRRLVRRGYNVTFFFVFLSVF